MCQKNLILSCLRGAYSANMTLTFEKVCFFHATHRFDIPNTNLPSFMKIHICSTELWLGHKKTDGRADGRCKILFCPLFLSGSGIRKCIIICFVFNGLTKIKRILEKISAPGRFILFDILIVFISNKCFYYCYC